MDRESKSDNVVEELGAELVPGSGFENEEPQTDAGTKQE